MHLQLIAMGNRMPSWVQDACAEYQKRLPKHWRFELLEIPLAKRSKTTNNAQLCEQEANAMLSHISNDTHVIALEVLGDAAWDTPKLAQQLQSFEQEMPKVCLLIGGPDGLAESCRQRANQQWSLSPLTLPHPMVRIIVLEQLYRAWTIVTGHPYHRC